MAIEKMRKNEQGLLSLEASISLTIFIFLMLFMYSFFVFFEARNEMGHVALSTANSLSVDAYANAQLCETDTLAQVFYGVYGQAVSENTFTDHTAWHKDPSVTDEEGNTTISANLLAVIEERFLAYLTGGDMSKAQEVLERLHVVGGVSGLDFSGSSIEGSDLHIVLRYTVEREFHVFGDGKYTIEQSVCSRLWDKGDA